MTSSEAELRRRVAEVPVWFHSMDLGAGVVTPGFKGPEHLRRELASLRLPDVTGKSVLDIGAWDGFYSFEAERRGARRVVALDHHAWSLDLGEPAPLPAGAAPDPGLPERFRDRPERWRPDLLPGKRGFDVARQALDSAVEARAEEFMECDPDAVGRFEVVLFLGVLYHMPDPLGALRRLRAVTSEVAVIETAGVEVDGREEAALWEFYGAGELHDDPSNWWAPNARALCSACLAAGFREAEVVGRAEGLPAPPPATGIARPRLIAHART